MSARFAAALAAALLAGGIGPAGAQDEQSFSLIARGRYLASVGDCTACHTPEGGPLYSGGKPLQTPFGTLLAPNITPDRVTGIGAWTDDEFVNALKVGTGHNGAYVYPAMPYTYYTKATRQDALAIRAYLATVEPVNHPVHSNQLPFPFNVRESLAAWNELFFKPETFKPVADKSAEWNRGAYLTEGLAHCGMCHTPKNQLGADQSGRAYQGYALQGWFAPALTNDPHAGIGAWSVDDLVLYLKTGRNRFDIASGPMAEAVSDSTSRMTVSDLRAIAVYLKDQPAPSGAAPAPLAADDARMKAGAAIYADNCAACHTFGGGGIVGLFPRLAGAPLVQQADPTSLIHVVLHGNRAVATDAAPTGPAMPTYDWKLNDSQIAAVVTYIRNSWGNAAPAVDAATVTSARRTPLASTQ